MKIFNLIITTDKKRNEEIANAIETAVKSYQSSIECVSTLRRKELEDENASLKQELEEYQELMWARQLFLKFLKGE
jgi:hypothetical protein